MAKSTKQPEKSNKKKIILPIVICATLVVVTAGILLGVLLPPRIIAKKYFASIASSPYTKQVQTTTMKEGDKLVYEKIESLTIDGDVMYHKIVEKELSDNYDTQYSITSTEYYYTATSAYYYEDNQWKIKDFNVSNKFNSYNFKYGLFKDLKFDKSIKTTGTLEGNLKPTAVAKVDYSLSSLSGVYVKIVVDKGYNIQNFNITGKTSSSRDVVIENTYTYNSESVYLPTL